MSRDCENNPKNTVLSRENPLCSIAFTTTRTTYAYAGIFVINIQKPLTTRVQDSRNSVFTNLTTLN